MWFFDTAHIMKNVQRERTLKNENHKETYLNTQEQILLNDKSRIYFICLRDEFYVTEDNTRWGGGGGHKDPIH